MAAQILLTDKADVSEKYLAELLPYTQTEELTLLTSEAWYGE